MLKCLFNNLEYKMYNNMTNNVLKVNNNVQYKCNTNF